MRMIAMLLAAPTALISISAPAQEVQWTDWSLMNPNSYKVSIAEMTNRCLAGAAVTTVTSIECEEVTAMIQASRCAFEPVPDGIRYEFMNGLRASKPHVYTNKVKALGAARMAYVCKTSTDRVFDWYVGEDGISCGNLGAREFVPIPRLTITPPPPVRPSVVITTTIAPAQPEGSSASAPYFYWPAPAYSGGNTNVRVKNSTRSTSTANATTKGGCTICTPSPKH